ncbi:MAG TPA: hypothetical protein VF746_24340 [Longimicrobium sp.]|jgi:hypothetical protein
MRALAFSRLVLAAAILAACLAAAPALAQEGSATAQHPRAAPRGSLIKLEEIERSGATDTYELVRRLRPAWFRGARGASSLGAQPAVVVYLNGIRHGGASSLRDIPLGHVREIRFLDAPDATTRFGIGHGAGAIDVITR